MRNEEPVISWGEESQIPSIHSCYNSANHTHFPEIRELGTLDYVTRTCSLIPNIVARVGDTIVGWLGFRIADGNSRLEALYVEGPWQRKGVGSRLLAFYFRHLYLNQVRTAASRVFMGFPSPRNFLEKHEFRLYRSPDNDLELKRYGGLWSFLESETEGGQSRSLLFYRILLPFQDFPAAPPSGSIACV